ncbi:hypothetical protein L3V86_08625 [Thiotrichales bacterium 19S11-10]|nr:hypothetical protein [Thiotrichales bacterium 19S11-10]
MEEIKEYKSVFATKLNYVLDKLGHNPIQQGRIKAIEKVTNEKCTTVNNWLISGKLPRSSKMLSIADSLGVSEDYLFSDKIDVKAIRKPEIVKKDNCYLIPVFEESEIFKVKNSNIFPVKQRIPVMFPSFDKLVELHGKNIYATKLTNSSFEPQVEANSTIIYSEHAVFDDYSLIIIKSEEGAPEIRQIVLENGKLKLAYINNGQEVVELFDKEKEAVSIIYNFS